MTKSPSVKPVYAVVGPDRYLRQQALDELLSRISTDPESLGVARYKGDDADLAEVLDEARTPSLLGGRRTVLLDEADDFISSHRQALERYCAAPADSSSLVLVCQSLPGNTRLYKIIHRVGEVISIAAPVGRNLIGWITQRARGTHGKAIAPVAAQRLRDSCGDAPGILDAELAKLATYLGERPEITEADVEALSGQTREEKVFAVMDAVFAEDAPEALRHWEQVVATDRAAPAKAVGGLAWSVRRICQAKIDFESGVSMFELSKRFFTDAATVERRLRAVDGHQLMDMQRDLLAADIGIKTGATTAETAVESFIVKHCSRSRRPRAIAR
jgi:DNA polymerase-3 subunit delta